MTRWVGFIAALLCLVTPGSRPATAQRCVPPPPGCQVFVYGRNFVYGGSCANACSTSWGWCHIAPQLLSNRPCVCLTAQNAQVPGRSIVFPNLETPSPYLRPDSLAAEFCH